MYAFYQDLRFGFRMLFKSPGFTAVAILTLALGIGANTAIFSIVNAVLLRPPPFPHPEQLVMMSEHSKNFGEMSVAYPNFLDWQKQQDVFSSIAAFRNQSWNLTGTGQPERIDAFQVSASFFPLLGVQPVLGRTFVEEDDKVDGNRVVVLSEGLWKRRYGSDPKILGKTVHLDGQGYEVIGVMPAAFSLPRRVELWTPIGHRMPWTEQRGWHPGIYAIGRMKPSLNLAQAQAGMKTITDRLAKEYPNTNEGGAVTMRPVQEQLVGQTIRSAMSVLMAATGFVLLIACTNVANLLLARATQRRKEIAIRLAIGASRWQVVRQLLSESLLLSVLGGLAGLGMALFTVDFIGGMLPSFLTEFVTISIDRNVLAFTLLSALATGILFGLAPAWSLVKKESQDALKEGSRGESAVFHRNWGRRALIVSEVALALLLLIGAGLLIRSFANLQSVPVGVDSRNVLVADLSLPAYKYNDEPKQLAFYERALEQLKRLPGVKNAGMIAPLPFGIGGWQTSVRIEGEPPAKNGEERFSEMAIVSPDYFQTMGVTILQGRSFNESDTGKPRVCIIDESFAIKHFKGEGLGKRIADGNNTNWMTIIGIAQHVKINGAAQEARIQTYVPIKQNTPNDLSIVIRADRNPMGLANTVRQEILSLDPDQPLANVRTMDTVIAQTVAERRLAAMLLTIFAAIALALAVVGIYGVMSFSVANRTREIGIRMALGAQARDVLKLIVGQGGTLVFAGIGLGVVLSFAATRLMQGLLFGIGTTDLSTYIIVALLLSGIALLACFLPARRATRVNPTVALRQE